MFSSGPVGFGDAGYIAAYNAWSARMNELEAQLARLRCSPRPIRLVPPFGQCPPSSAINVITAGTPEIVAFTANDQTRSRPRALGQPLTLRWTVKNAAHCPNRPHLAVGRAVWWLDDVDSRLRARSPTPSDRRTTWSIGEWIYRITATGACGGPMSRTVTVVTAKQPALSIAQMQDHAVDPKCLITP